MRDQKAENLLNLALATPEPEREKTDELYVGYNIEAKTWELIVKYHGELLEVLKEWFPAVQAEFLLNNYAILLVPETEVEAVIALPQIEYAEKPKRLFFAVNQAKTASCLLPVQTGAAGLTGKGVLAAVVDSGIDYFHEDFCYENGESRILFLADQVTGEVYSREQINEALKSGSREAARAIVPSQDASGHGTAVAGILAGNGRESGGRYRGVAWESELIVVRLGAPDPEGFPRTTQLMSGLNFVVRTALELGKPLAVNLSFGNTYGSHDGNGLLERYLDSVAQMGQTVIAVGTGNEGGAGGHGRFLLQEGEWAEAELAVAAYETGFGLQIWKSYEDSIRISIRNPAGSITEALSRERGAYRLSMGRTELLIYYGEPGPFNMAQEIYIDFVPRGDYVESGNWSVFFQAEAVSDGRVDLWLPSAAVLNRSTRILRPEPETTLTIPSTAQRVISVGAYDDSTKAYAPFSGRGDTRHYQIQKPDLAAPGVGIIAPRRGGGYEPVTGTSFAAPFVTGAAALLMEWGIVRGNDPYLYGDKIKAYLRKGAEQIPAELEYPNPRLGYGVLCVEKSLPEGWREY